MKKSNMVKVFLLFYLFNQLLDKGLIIHLEINAMYLFTKLSMAAH